MSTNSLPYIYIGFLVEHYNKEEGKWKKKRDQLIFLLNVNFTIKIADNKKSKFNYEQRMVGMGGWVQTPDSISSGSQDITNLITTT